MKVVEEKFNLKTLVIKENLKRVGILSNRVGTKCKFIKFRKGVPVLSESEESSDEDHNEIETKLKSKSY